MIRRRRGFTFVELLIVIIVLGLLASLGVMRYLDLKYRALAASATSDMESVRLAAYGAMSNDADWPPEQPSGVVPPEMVPMLGSNFSFNRPEYQLDWENLGAGGGGMQVGMTVTSNNQRFMRALTQIVANKGPFIMVGNQLTLVIVGPDGTH